MPIFDIELVGAGTDFAPGLAQALADELGEAFGADPGRIWIRLRTLSATNYAENQVTAPNPAFVTVLASTPPSGPALAAQIAEITAIVARHTDRPEDLVHVLFEPPARGRIAFGGHLVE